MGIPDERPDLDPLSESELLDRCRDGDPRAFETLFRRHHAAAVRYAAHLTSRIDPDDLASEAFARIWSALRGGGGPERMFEPYLRTTIRNVASTLAKRNREDATADDRLEHGIRRNGRVTDDGFSTALAEHQIVTTAFNTLPPRWRSVLWMIDVEGRRTSEVARDLGLSPNSTAALTKRARDALSRAWLQAHVDSGGGRPECRWTMEHAGGFARQALSTTQATRIRSHIDQCVPCERAIHRVTHLAVSLRIAALVGGGSAAGLLAWSLGEAPQAIAATSPAVTGGLGDTAPTATGRGVVRSLRCSSRPVRAAIWTTAGVAMVTILAATSSAAPTSPIAAPALALSRPSPWPPVPADLPSTPETAPSVATDTEPETPSSPTTPAPDRPSPEGTTPTTTEALPDPRPTGQPAGPTTPAPTPTEPAAPAEVKPTPTPTPTPTLTSTPTPTEPALDPEPVTPDPGVSPTPTPPAVTPEESPPPAADPVPTEPEPSDDSDRESRCSHPGHWHWWCRTTSP